MATSLATSQSDTIIAKPSAKSIVWEYFGVEKGSNGRPTNLGTLFKNEDQESENTNSQTWSLPSISTHEQLQREFLSYVTIPRLDFEENPLDWWKAHSSTYPSLAVFAKRFLCICATRSPSERLFSSSGHIVSPVRMKLKPDKVNMLTFLSKNLD